MCSMNKFVVIGFVLFISGLACKESVASPNNPFAPLIKTYTNEDHYWGATQNAAIIQDEFGRMYFGNRNYGILIFDGINWELIETRNNTEAHSFDVHENGRIYYGAVNEFGYVDADSIYAPTPVSLYEPHSDTLHEFGRVGYTYSAGEKLFFADEDHQFVVFDQHELLVHGQPDSVTTYYEDHDRFYAVTESGSHYHIDESGWQLVETTDVDIYTDDILVVNDSLHLYIDTRDPAFALINPKTSELHEMARPDAEEMRSTVLLPDEETLAFIDPGNGVTVSDFYGEIIESIPRRSGIRGTLSNFLFADQNSNLWLTSNTGINLIEYGSNLREFSDTYLEDEEQIRSIYEFEGDLYASTSRAFQVWGNGEMQTILPDFSTWRTHQTESGIFLIDSDQTFFYDKDETHFLFDFNLADIAESHQFDDLLYAYSISTNELGYIDISESPDSWEFQAIKDIGTGTGQTLHNDQNGDLWLGGGSSQFHHFEISDVDGLPVVTDATHYDSTRGVPEGSFNFTSQWGDELLFITENGLYTLDEETDSLKPDPRFREFHDETDASRLWPVLEDQDGRLWFDHGGSQSGYFTKTESDSITYTLQPFRRMDPFQSNTHIHPAGKHTVYFTSNYNAKRFDLDHPDHQDSSFHTLISSFTMDQDSVLFGGMTGSEASLPGNPLSYDSSQRYGFQWSGTHYPAVEGYRNSRYRLIGYDDEWSDWQEDEYQTYYTGLPAGDYTFEAEVQNVYGETGKTAQLHFSINPPWYRHTMAYISYGLILLGMIGTVVRVRTRSFRKRQQELEQTVAHRTKELKTKNEKISSQAQQLKELDEAKSRFFANISHELKTPLTLISGPLQELQEHEHLNQLPEISEEINRMHRNSRHLERLVRQLLDLARLESGAFPVNRQPLAVQNILNRSVYSFKSAAQSRDIELSVSAPEQQVIVNADAEHLEQIITNLIGNAIKFTGDGGQITAELSSNTSRATIAVSDSGIGIAEDQLDRLFDRFYQLDHRETHQGSGLGLSIVKELVELNGGSVEVESTPEVGSTFKIHLPLADNQQLVNDTPEPRTTESAPVLNDPKEELPATNGKQPHAQLTEILLVEDHPEMAGYIRQILEKENYVVNITPDGSEALKYIDSNRRPDLIICDIMMPKMDGFTFISVLKQLDEQITIPVILLSALDDKETRLKGIRLGIDDYLTKPFDATLLKARVASLISSNNRRMEWISKNGSLYNRAKEESEQHAAELYDRAHQIVTDNLTNSQFGVEHLAEQLHLSRRQLNRRIKEITGVTPQKFITNIRLEYAWQMIDQGTISSVSMLAEACGYRDVPSFSRAFKERFGLPPKLKIQQNQDS